VSPTRCCACEKQTNKPIINNRRVYAWQCPVSKDGKTTQDLECEPGADSELEIF